MRHRQLSPAGLGTASDTWPLAFLVVCWARNIWRCVAPRSSMKMEPRRPNQTSKSSPSSVVRLTCGAWTSGTSMATPHRCVLSWSVVCPSAVWSGDWPCSNSCSSSRSCVPETDTALQEAAGLYRSVYEQPGIRRNRHFNTVCNCF